MGRVTIDLTKEEEAALLRACNSDDLAGIAKSIVVRYAQNLIEFASLVSRPSTGRRPRSPSGRWDLRWRRGAQSFSADTSWTRSLRVAEK